MSKGFCRYKEVKEHFCSYLIQGIGWTSIEIRGYRYPEKEAYQFEINSCALQYKEDVDSSIIYTSPYFHSKQDATDHFLKLIKLTRIKKGKEWHELGTDLKKMLCGIT